jgi:uncharacterized membrane protein
MFGKKNKLTNVEETAPSTGDRTGYGSSTVASDYAASRNDGADNNNNTVGGVYKWVNLIAYSINVAVTFGIGSFGLFGLPTNAELSEKYQTLVTPVGWAFSIWGIIFVSQALWTLRQFCKAPEQFVESVQQAVGFKYVFTVIAQAGWTMTFSQELIPVSLILMACIWINLLQIVRSFNEVNSSRLNASNDFKSTAMNYLLAMFPFAVHFGWITAATVVNANLVLVYENYSASTQFLASIGGLALLVVFALVLLFFGYSTVPLVLAWALLGVYVELSMPKESIVNAFSETQIDSIRYGAIVAMSVTLLLTLLQSIRLVRQAQNTNSEPQEAVYLRAEERRQAGSRMYL